MVGLIVLMVIGAIGGEVYDCDVQFQMELPEKPDMQHKAEPESTHDPQSPVLIVESYQFVSLQCNCCCMNQEQFKHAVNPILFEGRQDDNITNLTGKSIGRLQYKIESSKGHVVVLSKNKETHDHTKSHHAASKQKASLKRCLERDACSELFINANCAQGNQSNPDGFYMYADNLGRSQVTATLIWTNGSMDYNTIDVDDATTAWQVAAARIRINSSGNVTEEWASALDVVIVLRPQKFQLASDWSAAIIAFMLALSVGCCNEPNALRYYLSQPRNVIIELVCQMLLIPLIALGIGRCFFMDTDQAFGLFVTAAVPSGGLAYLLTYLVRGDRHLSAVLSLVACCVNLAACPAWMITVGWYYYERPIHLGKTIGWLGTITFAQTVGTLIRACRPGVAYAILTWVTRPLLLLSGILLVTLGIYINQYAFREINRFLLLSLLTFITLTFLMGWIAARANHQDMAVTKAMATELAVFNGLLCMPLLRTAVPAPEGDLAAVVPLWMTLFFPIPLVYHAILTVANRRLTKYLNNRRKNRNRSFRSVLVGMDDGSDTQMVELGATSTAAVTAAAIAVAPAIAATEHQRGRKSGDTSKDHNGNFFTKSSVRTDDGRSLEMRSPQNTRNSNTRINETRGTLKSPQNHNELHPDRLVTAPVRKISSQRHVYDPHATVYENPVSMASPRRTERLRTSPYTNL